MRNKGYVLGFAIAGLVLTVLAIKSWFGDGGLLFILPPAGLAVAMFIAAYKVSQAESFAPTNQRRWDSSGDSPNLKRWLKGRK